MALSFEWDKDLHGADILLVRKTRGKISVPELQEEMRKNYGYHGAWAILFKAQEESGYQGWGDEQDPKGDVLELYRIDDGETCPLCAVAYSGVTYCPHCGERLREE